MVLWKRSSSDESIVGFKIFSEFNKVICFFPKLDVSINAESNDEISFIRGDDVIYDVSMHVTNLIDFWGWQTLK